MLPANNVSGIAPYTLHLLQSDHDLKMSTEGNTDHHPASCIDKSTEGNTGNGPALPAQMQHPGLPTFTVQANL
eukprot:771021-Pelagomonas_calceolata.AAC.1